MIQLLLNKTTPPFQLLPMPKVDQSSLRIHEAPPLQKAKSQVYNSSSTLIPTRDGSGSVVVECLTRDRPLSYIEGLRVRASPVPLRCFIEQDTLILA